MNIRHKVRHTLDATRHTLDVTRHRLDVTHNCKNWEEVLKAEEKGQEPNKIILRNGLRLESQARLMESMQEVFFSKVYNPGSLTIGSNDIVVDIGANAGIFTVFAASITHNAVYAFEPFPSTFEVLKRNIDANKLKHVFAYCSAVSDKVGQTKLFFNPDDNRQNVLSDHILRDKIEQCETDGYPLVYLSSAIEKPERYVEVSTTTLQEIMDSHQIEQIDFLKLDCEGAEEAILQSTPKAYLQRVRKISMEFHNFLTRSSHVELQKMLEDVGFITEVKSHHPLIGYIYAWRK